MVAHLFQAARSTDSTDRWSWPNPTRLSEFQILENQPQPKLHLSIGSCRASNHTETRIAQRRSGRSELWRVEKVECLTTEFEPPGIANRQFEIPLQAKIR